MFRRKRTKIVIVDPVFFGKNHNSLKSLRDKGWIVIIAPPVSVSILEAK